ncbi:MAG: hypothetical protein ABIO70_30970 [Pseudomonadota bacterium]
MQHGHHLHERHPDHRHTCRVCGQHRALARAGGRRVALLDHDMCDRCWRSLLDRVRGERLGTPPTPAAPQIQAA